jgi:hypothetical protein
VQEQSPSAELDEPLDDVVRHPSSTCSIIPMENLVVGFLFPSPTRDPKEPASFGWSFQLFFHSYIGKGLELATHHLISLMPRCASLQRWRGG